LEKVNEVKSLHTEARVTSGFVVEHMEELLMKRLFAVLAVLAVVVFCISGAIAEETPHSHIAVLKHAPSDVRPLTGPPTGLWIPWADFAAFSNATNSDGTFLWPCFGSYVPSSGTNTGIAANPDCPTIGDPSVPFPNGGVVVGNPNYLWAVADCNATSTSAPNCGDQETFVTDNTADLTDDLFFSLVITQGTTTIYDSGTQVYGANVFGLTAADFPIIWINYNPQNLGDQGITTGPNNGNCLANLNYPLTSDTSPTFPYYIAGGKTCGAATAGVATGTVTIEYGKPAYTKETTAAKCDGVTPPCYTVKFTKEHEATYKFTIDLY